MKPQLDKAVTLVRYFHGKKQNAEEGADTGRVLRCVKIKSECVASRKTPHSIMTHVDQIGCFTLFFSQARVQRPFASIW